MNRNEHVSLEDVLDAYLAAVPEPSHAALVEWIQKYPQYTKELTDFTVSWSLMETLPSALGAEHTDEESFVFRGRRIAQNIRASQIEPRQILDEEQAITGILSEGRRQNLDIEQIAEQTKLSDALVRELDRRLIQPDSIPRQAIDSIAILFHRPVRAVRNYLRGDPKFASKARYHSQRAPILSRQRDFFDAIRSDHTISEENRKYWLAFEPPSTIKEDSQHESLG